MKLESSGRKADMTKFQELKDLRLDELLRSPQFIEVFPEGLTDDERFQFLFQETTHAHVWVTDDVLSGYSIFVFDTNGVNKDKLLYVTNPAAHTVFLWAIDGKMFKRLSKCDCAIISDKILHLVEFKANVESENLLTIGEHYDKASEQLSLTIKYITEAYENLDTDIFDIFNDIDAKIVFDKQIPQDNAYQKKVSSKFNKENLIVLTFGNDLKL